MHPSENFLRLAQPDDGISLLDLLVTISQNIKLLVLGPLTAGLCALGVTFAVPAAYESVAIVPTDAAFINFKSILRLPSVLDQVVVSQGLAKGKSVEQARLDLDGRIKTAVARQDKFLTLTVSGESPQQAQATATALLTQIYQQNRPRGISKARLEAQLASAKQSLADAQRTSVGLLGVLERGIKSDAALKSSGIDVSKSYTDLLAILAGMQLQVVSIERQLEGMSDEQLLQTPSLPEKPVSQKKAMIATVVALGTGFALLLWVFVRSGLRAAVADPASAAKLAAIRHDLGLAAKT